MARQAFAPRYRSRRRIFRKAAPHSRDNLRQDGHRHVPRVFPTIQLVRRREGDHTEPDLQQNLIDSLLLDKAGTVHVEDTQRGVDWFWKY